MSDVYRALGGYEGPQEEASLVSSKKQKRPLSLDFSDIKQELLQDKQFMKYLSDMEKTLESNVSKSPLAPFGGRDDPDEKWRGGETIYKPIHPPERSPEGSFTQGATLRELIKRRAVRAFQNKFGREPTEQEIGALHEAMRKSLIDWGQDINPPWEEEVDFEPTPRRT